MKCDKPCVVFQTSSDHGKTWSRKLVPIEGVSIGQMGARIGVAVDPGHRDRYAVMASTNAGKSLELWLSDDGADTWKKVKAIDSPAGDAQEKWSIAFSPTGHLGAVWRTVHSDSTYDVSAIVSDESGAAFGEVISLTPKPSAPSGVGDDCACNLQLDAMGRLSTAWGDSRSGNREVWFGRFQFANPARAGCP